MRPIAVALLLAALTMPAYANRAPIPLQPKIATFTTQVVVTANDGPNVPYLAIPQKVVDQAVNSAKAEAGGALAPRASLNYVIAGLALCAALTTTGLVFARKGKMRTLMVAAAGLLMAGAAATAIADVPRRDKVEEDKPKLDPNTVEVTVRIIPDGEKVQLALTPELLKQIVEANKPK